MYVKPIYTTDYLYHVYDRGIAKQDIFHSDKDYLRMIDSISYYLDKIIPMRLSKIDKNELKKILSIEPKKPLIEIYAYCLMPNHFHILIRQLEDNGITIFMKRLLNSYTRYYNVKNNRVGTIFQGRFKGILIDNDTQLLHLSRYIHLNPFVAGITKNISDYRWSSYNNYLMTEKTRICHSNYIINMAGTNTRYTEFVENYASYAQELNIIKHLLHDTSHDN